MTAPKLLTIVKTGLNYVFRKPSHQMEENKTEMWH